MHHLKADPLPQAFCWTRFDPLPQAFCWTRFGPESGESFSDILARKELERQAGGGTFYWGIGSAVGRALEALVSGIGEPEVLFSPISSKARIADVSPARVARWRAGQGLLGESILLPDHARVTSRWDPGRPNAARYALVCASDEPLRLENHGEIRFGSLQNFCSGAPVGASQVTAVVRRNNSPPPCGRAYPVALRASLVEPYFLRLTSPTQVDECESATRTTFSLVP